MDHGYRYMYEYDYPAGSGADGVFGVIMSVYLIILTLVLIFALVSYIFHSIGLYTIGKRMGKEYPWLAFIPYARDYFQGELAGEIRLKNKVVRNPGIWNLVIPIISSVLAGIFVVIIMIVAGVGAAAQIAGYGGLGIAALFSILLYTLLIAAVIALGAAQMVLTVLINKQILERFTSGNMATVHAVLTIAVPLYQAFCFFVMRNREFNPGMEPKITPPPTPITPITPGGPGAAVPPPSVQVTPVTPEKPAEPAAPAGPLPKEDEGRAETSVSEPSAVRSQSTDETDKTE